jgi:hypothetical protein
LLVIRNVLDAVGKAGRSNQLLDTEVCETGEFTGVSVEDLNVVGCGPFQDPRVVEPRVVKFVRLESVPNLIEKTAEFVEATKGTLDNRVLIGILPVPRRYG